MLNLNITQSIMLRWQRRRQHQSWHKFPQISSALIQSSFKAYVTLNNIQASTIIGIYQFLDMQTAATRFSYNWSYTNPNDLQEDILEILWNCLQFIFKPISMIPKLTRLNRHIYQGWSRNSRKLQFLKTNLEQS